MNWLSRLTCKHEWEDPARTGKHNPWYDPDIVVVRKGMYGKRIIGECGKCGKYRCEND